MKPKPQLTEMKLSRLEKLASTLRMVTECEVEVVASPDRVKFIVYPPSESAFPGYVVTEIVRFCHRHGLLFNVFAFAKWPFEIWTVKLTIEIYQI